MSVAEHEAAIAQLLAELGDTADAVADKLRAKGIKGRRGSDAVSSCCPIANVLGGAGYADVAVFGDSAECFSPLNTLVNVDPLPDPIIDFISRFDDGVYLDLVEVDG